MKLNHETHGPHGHMALRADTKATEHRLAAETKTTRAFRVPKGFRALSCSAEGLAPILCAATRLSVCSVVVSNCDSDEFHWQPEEVPVAQPPRLQPCEKATNLNFRATDRTGSTHKGGSNCNTPTSGLGCVQPLVRHERSNAPKVALRVGEGRDERRWHGCEVKGVTDRRTRGGHELRPRERIRRPILGKDECHARIGGREQGRRNGDSQDVRHDHRHSAATRKNCEASCAST